MNNDATYEKIAQDIAEKIISGEFPEGSILKGRSLLASLYSVSPETIRKSIQLLAKEKILFVKHGVGVFVDSREKAIQYKAKYKNHLKISENSLHVKSLISQMKELTNQIDKSMTDLEKNYRFQINEKIDFFEVYIDKSSWICNKTIGEVYFWNYTESTIVGILRGKDGILQVSPGPDMPLCGGDKIIFVGKDELSYERVLTFLKYGVEE